jgi:hypothetical protein
LLVSRATPQKPIKITTTATNVVPVTFSSFAVQHLQVVFNGSN